jgi:hypothetical protein
MKDAPSPERLAERLARERGRDRTARHDTAVREEQRVRDEARDLLDVVGDDERRRSAVRDETLDVDEESLARYRVERHTRLVEHEELGRLHERTRDQHPLLLALREVPVRTVRERLRAEPSEGLAATAAVLVVIRPPRTDHRIEARRDDLVRPIRQANPRAERRADDTHAPLHRVHVAATVRVAEHAHEASARPLVRREDRQERALPSAIGPEDRPVLAACDLEPDVVEHDSLVAFPALDVHLEDLLHRSPYPVCGPPLQPARASST